MSLLVELEEIQKRLFPRQMNLFIHEQNNHILFKIQRHTQFIHLLRIACPTFTLFLILVYILKLSGSGGVLSRLPQVPLPHITTQDLAMHNPHYEGVTKDGGTYQIKAKVARQDFGNMNLIELETITGELTQINKSKTYLNATRGTFDQKENVLELKEKIEITTDNGTKAQLKSATVKIKDGVTVSHEPVLASFPAGTIEANEIIVVQKEHKISFLSEVICHLKPNTIDEPGQKKSPANSPFISSNEPLKITSSRLDIDDNRKTATFIGDVRANQSSSSLESPEMIVHYEQAQHELMHETKGGLPDRQNATVKKIEVKGPFMMMRGDKEQITGDNAFFDNINRRGDIQGNVIIISSPDKKITADRVELDQNEDSALLTGNAILINGDTILKGHRLFVDRKKSQTSLTSLSINNSSSARITAHFVRKNAGQMNPTLTSSLPATASQTFGQGELKTNSNAPIDIESARLDIDDLKKTATFKENVNVQQSGVLMVTPTLKAYYTGSAKLADPENMQKSSSSPKPSNQLTRLEATESVFLKTEDGRKVNGDWATYEAKTNLLVVGGDVELTQGSSVIRGNRLIIDMTTRKSTIDTAPILANSKPNGKLLDPSLESSKQSSTSRPSAIFFPSELKENKEERGASNRNSTTSKDWSSVTSQ